MIITFSLTDLLAWVGAVSGLVALFWQIYTWRRPGHRVKVSRTNAIRVGHVEEWLLCVSARNIGTSSVTVTGWGVNIGRSEGSFYAQHSHVLSASLPHRLDPGAKADFYIDMRELVAYAKQREVPLRNLRCRVDLATGEEVFAKKHGIPYRDS